jgi:MerR family transcriptional regulator, redox-sensitive transcriptional activator SoxR
MRELTIGQLSRQTGVPASAIRYYEAEGVLPAPLRAAGRRRYTERTIRLLEVLRAAKEAGFTLAEIKVLFRGLDEGRALGRTWRGLARRKMAELDRLQLRIAGMRATLDAGLRCGCLRLEDCVLGGRITTSGTGRGQWS